MYGHDSFLIESEAVGAFIRQALDEAFGAAGPQTVAPQGAEVKHNLQLPEDSPLLPMVTSTAENCLGQECPHFSECFLMEARRRAQEALSTFGVDSPRARASSDRVAAPIRASSVRTLSERARDLIVFCSVLS